jgi:hypothetical protein
VNEPLTTSGRRDGPPADPGGSGVLHVHGPLRWQARARRPPARTPGDEPEVADAAHAAAEPACDVHELPVTLASALLLVLARDGRWLTRSEIGALFWPDVPEAVALANLRVHLLRARQLVATLDAAPPMQAERVRLRWAPPRAGSAADGPLAEGFDLRGFPEFDAWLRAWRAQSAAPMPHAAPAGDTEVQRANGTPAPAGADFVGRRVEQARLRASAAAVLVVAGEPGIGKTRLLAETFTDAPWLRGQEGLQSVSFAPLTALLAAQPDWLADLGAYRLDVARLLPELLAPGEALPPLDALTARARLFEGLARAVEGHAARLLVDDLQWADAATTDWLLLLARRGRVRWAASARDAELPPALASSLDTLAAEGRAMQLTLAGLDDEALDSLRRRMRPDLAQGHWGQALRAGTGGNPFYARALLAALAPGERPDALPRQPPTQQVAAQLRQRLHHLPADARALAEAAALAVGRPAPAELAAMAAVAVDAALPALELAESEGLLAGTRCRHDLVRAALRAGIAPARATAMHVRAARHLAAAGAAPELVAHHWLAAGRADEAAPWRLAMAQRLRTLGDRDAARTMLDDVRAHAADSAQRLQAEILIAQEHLFDDLDAGRRDLETALARSAGVVQPGERRRLQAMALVGLLDNAVFSGDQARAAVLARQLRARLRGLPPSALADCHTVLIEQAMRAPDAAAAQASLQGLRAAGASEPVWMSFEAQIHWFFGAVREARDGFERLLARHPDYCRGLTIENDLAVMCQALGELDRAETMARRSLASWAGVPHTQALPQLVLGATLTSRGDFAGARAALDEAERLGVAQGSALFVAEARVRRARMHWCAGEAAAAREDLRAARAATEGAAQPLLSSAVALMRVLVDDEGDAADISTGTGGTGGAGGAGGAGGTGGAGGAGDARARDDDPMHALDELAQRCPHPLVLARRERARAARAAAAGDFASARAAAHAQLAIAERAQLAEWQCEAMWMLAAWEGRASGSPPAAEAADHATHARALARERGFGWLAPPPGDEAPPGPVAPAIR